MRSAPAIRVALGVDIGGTNIRAARVDEDGHVEWQRTIATDSGPEPTALVVELCREGLDDAVEAVGIGVPGRLDGERTTVLSSGYVELAGQRLGQVVGSALGRPVRLENDAAMALIAEHRLGAAVGAQDVVLFTAGTGIGGALAVGGKLLRGRGNAGQLGHLALDRSGPACNCGRQGCSEMLASGTALGHLMRANGLAPGTSVEALLERPDEPAAAAVLGRWSAAWRAAIDTVVAVLDPELVIIGGGLGAAVVAALETSRAATSPWFDCPVAAADLGDDAGVIGAGLCALSP
ncbi:MAG: ROK family protein [Candidatus Limnocylindrales bacterium]